ncbi:MAG TPA: MFS transporter [Bryobacteraceae bacterium]|nr:MFS transporter [Bryobacteraceae bacterium]
MSGAVAAAPASRYKWWLIGMLWFTCFFNYADRQAIYSVFPLLRSEMGLSDVQLGIIGGSFMWVYAACGPVAGIVGDRVERKTLIIGGLIFWSLITVLTGFAQNYWQLVLVRALEGFGEAFYFPASMSLISDYHGPETRSRAMSLHQSSVYAGTIAGGAVSGYMGQHFGWRSSFYVFGVLGVVLGLVLLVLLREAKRGQSEAVGAHVALDWRSSGTPRAIRLLLTHRIVLVLIAVFTGANFVAMIFLTWMPSFLYRKFNMSLGMAGLNSTAWDQMASVAGVLFGGYLADRWARRWPGGRMAVQGLGLLAGVPFLFLTGWTLSIPVLVLAMTGFGLFKGMYDANIWASLYDVVPPERRATAVGFMNSIGWLGGGFAPVAIAFASGTWGMSASISATAAIYFAFGLLMLRGFSLQKKTGTTS